MYMYVWYTGILGIKSVTLTAFALLSMQCMFLRRLGRQPFHGRNSEELQFMICHGSADMELISSAAHQEATKVTQIISQLLQKSSKSRSVVITTDIVH